MAHRQRPVAPSRKPVKVHRPTHRATTVSANSAVIAADAEPASLPLPFLIGKNILGGVLGGRQPPRSCRIKKNPVLSADCPRRVSVCRQCPAFRYGLRPTPDSVPRRRSASAQWTRQQLIQSRPIRICQPRSASLDPAGLTNNGKRVATQTARLDRSSTGRAVTGPRAIPGAAARGLRDAPVRPARPVFRPVFRPATLSPQQTRES